MAAINPAHAPPAPNSKKTRQLDAILKPRRAEAQYLRNDGQPISDAELAETARLNTRTGPFFTRARIKELLSLTDNEVDELIANHNLLAVTTEDEVELFPAFQLNTDRTQLRENIRCLVQILLASGVDPWVVVYWLTAPIKERENQRPIDLVDQRTNPQPATKHGPRGCGSVARGLATQ